MHNPHTSTIAGALLAYSAPFEYGSFRLLEHPIIAMNQSSGSPLMAPSHVRSSNVPCQLPGSPYQLRASPPRDLYEALRGAARGGDTCCFREFFRVSDWLVCASAPFDRMRQLASYLYHHHGDHGDSSTLPPPCSPPPEKSSRRGGRGGDRPGPPPTRAEVSSPTT